MLNEVFVGSNGVVVTVPESGGIVMRDFFVPDEMAAGYPEDFFESVSIEALEEMGAEYMRGYWGA